MKDAVRVRPWWIEGDYSYKIDRFAGLGWLLIGDALRFVDPIFSSGVDVAMFSAKYAYETITEALRTGNEAKPFAEYADRVETGVDCWYDLISMFYKLQNLLTRYATSPHRREAIIRTLQGNPYIPETQERARKLLADMQHSYDVVLNSPGNLMRPGDGPRQGRHAHVPRAWVWRTTGLRKRRSCAVDAAPRRPPRRRSPSHPRREVDRQVVSEHQLFLFLVDGGASAPPDLGGLAAVRLGIPQVVWRCWSSASASGHRSSGWYGRMRSTCCSWTTGQRELGSGMGDRRHPARPDQWARTD